MPGLIRGVARTAAIAGTATAVSNRVSRRQAGPVGRAGAAAARPAAGPYAEPHRRRRRHPPLPTWTTKLAQLKELGELKEAGCAERASSSSSRRRAS